jgi:hypothetical protein
MSYLEMLLEILDLNRWDQLPNYPEHFESLDEIEDSMEVQTYCKFVLMNLDLLVEVNK